MCFFFKLSFIAAKCSAKHSIHFHALMGICPPAVPAYHLCAPDLVVEVARTSGVKEETGSKGWAPHFATLFGQHAVSSATIVVFFGFYEMFHPQHLLVFCAQKISKIDR